MSGPASLPLWWRHLLLAGVVGGLLAAPGPIAAPAGWEPLCGAGLAVLIAVRRSALGAPPAGPVWAALIVGLGGLGGLGVGEAREVALGARAVEGEPGQLVRASGVVSSAPKLSAGELRFPLDTAEGRLIVSSRSAGDPTEVPPPGRRLLVRGRLASPEPFREDELRRAGAALELRARRIRALPGGRGGLAGALDRARTRAERGLTAGLAPGPAALARGFVLGQDERIPADVRKQFRRSGLAHLLAVSGQNVILLAILAGVLLTLVGVGPRARLVLVLLLIAAYVPIAGGGASIQRAGIMGGAGILAGLAGRPADRLYVLLLAAAGTLTLNPHAASDVGWQLSFGAVIGIALAARPLRALLLARLERLPGRVAEPLAEGAALTIAATVATGPLMVHHFESFSPAALPANLIVLPAVAPVMWLGMAAAMLGQLPLVPTEPIAWLQTPMLAYIAGVAELLARPEWALLRLPAGTLAAVAVAYLGLLAGGLAALRALRRRGVLRLAPRTRVAAAALALPPLLTLALAPGDRAPPADPRDLRITQLDVGQGDAILLESAGRAMLVDAGPPGAGLPEKLRAGGVERLDAVAITHDQLDHTGGLRELAGRIEIGRLLLARPAPEAAALAASAGAEVSWVAEGSGLRLGRARVTVLWPPVRPGSAAPGEDSNASSLVLAVEHAGWRALLTGDAEAEAVPLDPGPLDLLKVAHHGSADAGLERLLDRSAPRLALIGVGADNRHGHPAAATIEALGRRAVCVLRTDWDGDGWAELGPSGLRVGTERDPDPCSI